MALLFRDTWSLEAWIRVASKYSVMTEVSNKNRLTSYQIVGYVQSNNLLFQASPYLYTFD
jgi:hypothetical protein